MSDPIQSLAEALMRSVVRSGAVRSEDATIACKIMREEMKDFIAGEKYADERALVETGGSNLAYASLVATCVSRIIAERA